MQATIKIRNIDVQATPTMKSTMCGTGYELINAYLGERGDLVIKKTELSFAADKELQ